jgi:hypothetical protein
VALTTLLDYHANEATTEIIKLCPIQVVQVVIFEEIHFSKNVKKLITNFFTTQMTRRCRPLREFHVDDVEDPQLETVNQMTSKGNIENLIVVKVK